MPKRVQLSRRKGYKLPPNTVNIARPGKWGNPFIVGQHGDRRRCVELFRYLCAGYLCLGVDKECLQAQEKFRNHMKQHLQELRGHDLACWCRMDGQPCHGDVLLKLANEKDQ